MAKTKDFKDANELMLDLVKGAQDDAQGAQPEDTPSEEEEIKKDPPTNDEVVDDGPSAEEEEPKKEPEEEPADEDEPEKDTNESEDQSDKAEDDGLIEDWVDEKDEPIEEPKGTTEVDYSSLAKELGIEASTKEEFVEAVKKAAEPKPQEDVFAGLPDELREAVTIAKGDGDYLEYLKVKQIDYNGYDNLTLVQFSIKDAFVDQEGNLDTEAMNEYLDNLSEVDIKIQGNRIRQELKGAQQARLREYEAIAEGKRLEAQKELRQAVDSMKDVGGFKVHPSHKQKLYNDIESGKALEKMLRKSDGSYDYEKIADAYFKITYFDKMLDYHRKRAATQQKREILEDRYNVKKDSKDHLPNPERPETDPLSAYIKQLQSS